MPISIEADPTLAQGYLKVNGVTAATVTSTGLTTASLQDNAVTTSKVNNAAITAPKLSGGQTGSAPIYGCRAWVNFDGTTTPPTIRASGNVASVTRNSTGNYTITFTTAMPDASYSVTSSTNADFSSPASFSSGSFVFATNDGAYQPKNVSLINVAIFR